MRTFKDEKISILLLLFCVMLSFMIIFIAEGFDAAYAVREECLRLHVIADTDSEADQAVKLRVRDAILAETGDVFASCRSADEAVIKAAEMKDEIKEIAEGVLRENGFGYGAEIFIEEEYFGTRQYENVSLPAGNYTALRVVLGEGGGQNWWCVMFPPLCLPAVTANNEESVYGVFGENGGDLVTGKSGYKVKFRIVEIVEGIIEALKS